MTYAKMIDGNFRIAPKKLNGDGVVVYNPPAEMYAAQGWLPVKYTDAPEAPEGFYYESGWAEEEDAIVQTWKLVKLPSDIPGDEAMAIILGGDGE